MDRVLQIRTLRIIASFALLGAVLMGVATGWMEQPPVDFRAIGASVGALAASAVFFLKSRKQDQQVA